MSFAARAFASACSAATVGDCGTGFGLGRSTTMGLTVAGSASVIMDWINSDSATDHSTASLSTLTSAGFVALCTVVANAASRDHVVSAVGFTLRKLLDSGAAPCGCSVDGELAAATSVGLDSAAGAATA